MSGSFSHRKMRQGDGLQKHGTLVGETLFILINSFFIVYELCNQRYCYIKLPLRRTLQLQQNYQQLQN